MRSGRHPKAAEGTKCAAEGRPERKTSAGPCRVRNHSQRQAGAGLAVLRRVRVEMRPVGGSATEASDGGVGARGVKSGGVAQKGTAKNGVRVASAAGQNGARTRRSSPAPTKAETPLPTDLPVGAERSSILIRVPCAQKSRKSVELRGSPPKTSLSGGGTSPLKPMPGIDVEGVSRPQTLTRKKYLSAL